MGKTRKHDYDSIDQEIITNPNVPSALYLMVKYGISRTLANERIRKFKGVSKKRDSKYS